MKNLNVVASVAGAVLVGLGVAMVVTNPRPSAYNDYATERLTEYLKAEGCEKALLGQRQCVAALESAQPQIAELIRESTERQNFLLWSVYRTEFSLPLLPAYQFETVGAFQSFYTYEFQKD